MSFPYDFGYIPGTKAEDGDPIDVLLLMDPAAFPGCRVESRLIGVIEAEQIEDGEIVRNDRLVAVALESPDYDRLKSLKDMDAHLLQEIEHFFLSYNELKNKEFRLIAHRGPAAARRLLQEAIRGNGRKR
jgi:inorganic pyrophosphatase